MATNPRELGARAPLYLDLEHIVGPGACEACRARITKCSTERPHCHECRSRHTQCVYPSAANTPTPTPTPTTHLVKKRKHGQVLPKDDFERVFMLLQRQPANVATDIFRRIRHGADVPDILRYVQYGNLRLQLSLVPDTSYQFSSPYLADMMPIFRDPDNHYLTSTLYKSLTVPTPEAPQFQNATKPDGGAPYRIPYAGAHMYDPRLSSESLHPSKWTSITSDDNLLRSLLEVYFLYEYPFWPCFHKDIFLDDMMAGKGDFCTPLLVNAVLTAACHGLAALRQRAEFWNPRTYSYMFLAETRRLWEVEQTRTMPSLAAAQAATILGRIYFVNSMDRLGSKIWAQALTMAEQLTLFSTPTGGVGEQERISRTITAWAIFSQQSFSCFYLMKPPAVRAPPKDSLPEPRKAPDFFGEIWIKYPLAPQPVPLYIGQTFLALAELRKVMNDIAYEVFSNKEVSTSIFLKQAKKHHTTLTRWYRNLPDVLQARNVVLPPHLFLHMQYHNLVSLTFTPFCHAESVFNGPHNKTSFEDYEGFSPTKVVASAKACLATLVHMFYHRHGFEGYYMFLLQILVQLGFNALDQLRASDASNKISPPAWKATRATLILCAKGMRDQGRNYYLGECVFRILRNKMSREDVNLLKQWAQIKEEEEHAKLMMEYVHGEYPVNVVAITQDPTEQRLQPMLESMTDGSRPHVHGSSSIF